MAPRVAAATLSVQHLPLCVTFVPLRQTARTVLGKFEVLLRADCLAVDLPLLYPYLAGGGPAGWVEDVGRY